MIISIKRSFRSQNNMASDGKKVSAERQFRAHRRKTPSYLVSGERDRNNYDSKQTKCNPAEIT